jgi:tryptophan synthase beta chain
MRWTMSSDRVPEAWYNVVPHLREPLQPPLHPRTREPVTPDLLTPLFPVALIRQEMSAETYIDIPGEVLDILRM